MSVANRFSVAAALVIAAFATAAHATTWNLEKTVTGVEITDDSNNGGSTKSMNIFLTSSGTYCGSSQSIINIKQTESTLWDHWVRLAESAALSGKPLVIYSSNASGTCKAWSIHLK
jgi:hypothetical protein